MTTAATHTLYRFYGNDGALLYVGRTADPSTRFKEHSRRKTWWTDVADIKLQTFDTSAELAHAERVAIASETPRYNIVLNPLVTQRRRESWGVDTLMSITPRSTQPQPQPQPEPLESDIQKAVKSLVSAAEELATRFRLRADHMLVEQPKRPRYYAQPKPLLHTERQTGRGTQEMLW